MKQTKILAVSALTALLLTGCGDKQISKSKAEEIALSHAGLSKEQVTFVKSETDLENGTLIYDVEFYTKDSQEYDYQIDAKTGEILSFDADAENGAASSQAAPDVPQLENEPVSGITEEQAKTAVLEKVPGASAEHIREFNTDRDDGRIEYEGKIVYQNKEYEFEIDAETGEIISWDEEAIAD